MAQEEQNQGCSNSSSGGCNRFSKKPKQKKIPRRGLGVAQLEKIRLEEQQRKDALVGASAILSTPPHVSPPTSSFLSLPIPDNPHSQSPTLVRFPSPSLSDLSPPNSLLKSVPSIPSIDVLNSINGGGGFDITWPAIPLPEHDSAPKLWNCEYNLEAENQRFDPGLPFRMNSPYEMNPMWSLPNVMQKAQPYQPSLSLTSLSSTTTSSVINCQLEPPSNQSFCGNHIPLWHKEEKMAGMKRPYPFSLDNPPGPSFFYKYPHCINVSRSEDSASRGNGGKDSYKPRNPVFREAPSCSAAMAEAYSKKGIPENGAGSGDFLTLAPPAMATPIPSSNLKHPSAFADPHSSGVQRFEAFPYEGSAENRVRDKSRGANQHQPFYSFFPPAKAQSDQSSTAINNGKGEAGESVDLNLKL